MSYEAIWIIFKLKDCFIWFYLVPFHHNSKSSYYYIWNFRMSSNPWKRGKIEIKTNVSCITNMRPHLFTYFQTAKYLFFNFVLTYFYYSACVNFILFIMYQMIKYEYTDLHRLSFISARKNIRRIWRMITTHSIHNDAFIEISLLINGTCWKLRYSRINKYNIFGIWNEKWDKSISIIKQCWLKEKSFYRIEEKLILYSIIFVRFLTLFSLNTLIPYSRYVIRV